MLPAPEPTTVADRFCLGFPANPAKVRQALADLLDAPQLRRLGADDRGTVELVLAEVLNNIVEHAYAGGTGPVDVELWAMNRGLGFRVADAGSPMPGGTLPDGQPPELQGHGDGLSDLPEGGFGWHLIRSMTRDLTYARQGGQNLVTFKIQLDG
jgi:serine/threonine-protein kinase RsbW